MGNALFFALLLLFCLLALSQVQYIYLVPTSHWDIGFMAPPDEVADWCKPHLDKVINYCLIHADFKWTIETIWQVEEWLKRTPEPSRREELFRLIREGRISLSGLYTGVLSARLSALECLRLADFVGKLKRERRIPIVMAIANDIPGYDWSYPQVLTQAGIKYFVTGTNLFIGGGAKIPLKDIPFYWEGPDGRRLLTWVSYDGYPEGIMNWHIDPGAAKFFIPQLRDLTDEEVMERGIRRKLEELEREGYPYDAVLVLHSQDCLQPDTIVGALPHIRRWNQTHASPKIIVATPEDFFRHMEEKYGDSFPVYRGSWAGLWEQNAPLTNHSPFLRDAIPLIEEIWSLNSLLNGVPFPRDEVEDLYRRLWINDDHGFGCTTGWPKLMTHRQVLQHNIFASRFKKKLYEETTLLLGKGVKGLAQGVKSEKPFLFVFNPLSWKRSDIVRVELPASWKDFALKDAVTGEEVPHQLEDGLLIFRADDIPPLGYRVYLLEKTSSPFSLSLEVKGRRSIENQFYSIEVSDKGEILSLKRKGRELLRKDMPFNALVKTTGGNDYIGSDYRRIEGEVEGVWVREGKVKKEIIVRRSPPFYETRLALYDGLDRVEITNKGDKSATDYVPLEKHEEIYSFLFPFALSGKLQVYLEGPTSLLFLPSHLLPGAYRGGFTANHFLHIQGEEWGITFSPPQGTSLYVGKVTGRMRDTFPLREGLITCKAFSRADEGDTKDLGVQRIGIMDPFGEAKVEFKFAFSAREGAFSPLSAYRLGYETRIPLLACFAPKGKGSLNQPMASFFSLSSPSVAILGMKRLPGEWLEIALLELEGKEGEVSLTSLFPLVEGEVEGAKVPIALDGGLHFEIKPCQLLRVRVKIDPR